MEPDRAKDIIRPIAERRPDPATGHLFPPDNLKNRAGRGNTNNARIPIATAAATEGSDAANCPF